MQIPLVPSSMNKRLRISAILIAVGLVVELLTLEWDHLLSFIIFISLGAVLLVVGILFFLFSLTIDPHRLNKDDKPS
jgi:hypothetical protein